MKKINFIVLTVFIGSSLLLFSCSNEEDISEGNSIEEISKTNSDLLENCPNC